MFAVIRSAVRMCDATVNVRTQEACRVGGVVRDERYGTREAMEFNHARVGGVVREKL